MKYRMRVQDIRCHGPFGEDYFRVFFWPHAEKPSLGNIRLFQARGRPLSDEGRQAVWSAVQRGMSA